MKTSILVLAISMISASSSFAADLSLEQTSADLGACDGVAKLVKTADGQAEIRIKGVRRCSNVTLQMKLERKDQGEYSITLPVNLGKEADLQLSSNSGQTSSRLSVSTIEAETAPVLLSGQYRTLNNCLGNIRLSPQSNYAQPFVTLENVKNCNRFKVVSVNGHSFSFEQKLSDMGQFWGGSITLPRSAIQYGENRVKISVEGPMNKDQFVLVFTSY